MTINQKIRSTKKKLNIKKKPQEKGIVLKVSIMKPKKPNSAQRKVAKVKKNSGEIVNAYIPGINHNINQHSIVLIKHGITQDLPGVKYKIIRGVYDSSPVDRKTSRSKYGCKKK